MEYVDKPKPSPSYVALVVSLIVICGLPALAFPLIEGVVLVALFAVTIFPLVLLTIETFHAAYSTEYRISDDTIELRCGWLMHRRIRIDDIRSVENVKAISRVLGWSPGEWGYCNRFSDGLALKTSERVFYVSPADVHAFRAALKCGDASCVAKPSVPESNGVKEWVPLPFALLGILIVILTIPLIAGLVPPNRAYGLRTSTTMSSPEVWYPANRIGGIYMSGAGVAIVAGNLALFRYRRRLSDSVITVAAIGWTFLCVIGSLMLTLWHVG